MTVITNFISLIGERSLANNQLKLKASNIANIVRDKDTVHGKNANTGIFVSTPKHFVNGRAIGSTACSVR